MFKKIFYSLFLVSLCGVAIADEPKNLGLYIADKYIEEVPEFAPDMIYSIDTKYVNVFVLEDGIILKKGSKTIPVKEISFVKGKIVFKADKRREADRIYDCNFCHYRIRKISPPGNCPRCGHNSWTVD